LEIAEDINLKIVDIVSDWVCVLPFLPKPSILKAERDWMEVCLSFQKGVPGPKKIVKRVQSKKFLYAGEAAFSNKKALSVMLSAFLSLCRSLP